MAAPALAPAGIPARRLICPGICRDELAVTARRRLPREACWLLGGAVDAAGFRLQQLLWLPNAADGVQRFAVTAVAFARAEHELRRRGLLLLGFAHSHPGGAAALSPTDRRELWPDCVHLVVGLPSGRPPEFGAFWLRRDGVDTLSLEYSRP